MSYLHSFAGKPWLIEGRAMVDYVERLTAATPDAIQAAHKAAMSPYDRPPAPIMRGDVAVIPVSGPITYKPTIFSIFFGGATIVALRSQFRQALQDSAARSIAFVFDSPGGTVEMVPEFAQEVRAARGSKPIVAIADTLIASAAYWIAAQTDQIYATDSSQIGSIGCFAEHQDISEMLAKAGVKITLISFGANKVDGNPYEVLSDRAKAQIQKEVDQLGTEFVAGVAKGRGVSTRTVLDTYGQGDVFGGTEALRRGMATKRWSGALDDVLAGLPGGRMGTRALGSVRSQQELDEEMILMADIDYADAAIAIAERQHR